MMFDEKTNNIKNVKNIKLILYRSSYIFIFFFLLYPFKSGNSQESINEVETNKVSTISLTVGETKTLKFKNVVKEINVDNLELLNVVKGNDKYEIKLIAKKVGNLRCDVEFYDSKNASSFMVYIVDKLNFLKNEIKNKYPYLLVSIEKSKVVVKGNFKNKIDKKEFKKTYINSSYSQYIIDFTDISTIELYTIARNINNVLEEHSINNARARNYGQSILIEGSFINKEQSSLIKQLATEIYPNIEMNLSKSIDASDTLKIEVLFIEVERRKNLDIGNYSYKNGYSSISKEHPFTISSEPKSSDKKLLGLNLKWQVGPLFLFLDLIEKNSISKIFSNPKLIVRSGTEANFHSGNMVYLPKDVQNANVVRTEYEKVSTGIELKIKSTIDSIQRIDSNINIKVSNVVSLKDIPDVSISELNTFVTMNENQSILISGLSLKEDRKTVSKVPILGSIPLIGEVFKYRSKENMNKEILILLTVGRVVSYSDDKGLVDSFIERTDEDIKFSIFD